jgi:hypothetical protein
LGRHPPRRDSLWTYRTFLSAAAVLLVAAIIAIPFCGCLPLVIVVVGIVTAWILVHRMFAGG